MKNILLEPVFTEKMTYLTNDQNKYGFIVSQHSNKIEIAKTIEKKFNVKVENVNILNRDGKTKTQFRKSGRFTGKTSKYKKAIVTLKKGDKIEMFEQV